MKYLWLTDWTGESQ